MIPKLKLLERLMASGVVAVVRAENAEQAKKIADACIKGGIAAIEITFTVPGAAEVIKELAATYKPEELILGAGTVLDSETARLAILAGAQYVVLAGYMRILGAAFVQRSMRGFEKSLRVRLVGLVLVLPLVVIVTIIVFVNYN